MLGLTAEVLRTILDDPRGDLKLKLEASDRVWKWSGALREPTVEVQVQTPIAELTDEQLAERFRALAASF